MKTSCICHPKKNRYIQMHQWQRDFCQGNHAAAFLLAHFTAWHDWKLVNDRYYQRSNDIAEVHGDGRPNNENAYLFFTMDDLIIALMGLFGKKAISDGLSLLASLNVITVHKNPNPRYHFDKTKYFKFYPDVCNAWISNQSEISTEHDQYGSQVIDNYDMPKMEEASDINRRPSATDRQPSSTNRQAITDTTNNTTNKKKLINASNGFGKVEGDSILIETIIESLVEKGMPRSRFYPDAIQAIQRLHEAGATLKEFINGYDLAVKCTDGNGFGVNYLIKVVESLVSKIKRVGDLAADEKCNYRSDLKNAEKWASDLL